MTANITIGGVAFPVTDFEQAIETLHGGLKAGKSTKEIVQTLGEGSLPIIETVANYFFPGLGTGIEVLDFVVKNSTPFWALSQDEQNKIMDKQGMGPT